MDLYVCALFHCLIYLPFFIFSRWDILYKKLIRKGMKEYDDTKA